MDNWKHRSESMKCKTCMWFVEKVKAEMVLSQSAIDPSVVAVYPKITSPVIFGRCRRHSPTMNGFPAVFGSDWCGDHKLDEGKV